MKTPWGVLVGVALLSSIAACSGGGDGSHDPGETHGIRPDGNLQVPSTPTPSVDTTPTPIATATPWPKPTPIAGELMLRRTIPHGGWSEGLDRTGTELWHSFPAEIRVYDAASGMVLRSFDPPSTYSESLAWRDGELWNVSYDDANIYAGRLSEDGTEMTWRIVGTGPDVHEWGITHDAWSVIVTGNGQPYLYFLDPVDVSLQRIVETPVDDLEDIAFDRGAVWASSYSKYPGQFFRLDAQTGEILDVHSLPNAAECKIVDGIAVDDDSLYVTGKNCPSIYVYDLP